MENQEDKEIKTECSFKFHEFTTNVCDLTIACHLIQMENCLYLWVGDFNENSMNDLSFAIESEISKQPIATKIIGPIVDEISSNLAKKLSKKFSKAVYVSFNLQVDNMSLPAVEKKIREELNSYFNSL